MLLSKFNPFANYFSGSPWFSCFNLFYSWHQTTFGIGFLIELVRCNTAYTAYFIDFFKIKICRKFSVKYFSHTTSVHNWGNEKMWDFGKRSTANKTSRNRLFYYWIHWRFRITKKNSTKGFFFHCIKIYAQNYCHPHGS